MGDGERVHVLYDEDMIATSPATADLIQKNRIYADRSTLRICERNGRVLGLCTAVFSRQQSIEVNQILKCDFDLVVEAQLFEQTVVYHVSPNLIYGIHAMSHYTCLVTY